MVLGIDALIAAVSLWLAYLLRFDGAVPEARLASLPLLLLLVVASRLAANLFYRLHRWSFRFSGLADGARVATAGVAGSGLFALGVYLLRPEPLPPRSVLLIELLLSVALMSFVRFSPRLFMVYQTDRRRARREGGTVRTLIFGAGAAGELLLRDLQRSDEHAYEVIGFVDDDEGKLGHVVGGRTVLGTVRDLPELVPRHGVRQILIAVPRLPAHRVREILAQCADLALDFKILPVSYVYLQERAAPSVLKDLSTADLLAREVVTFDQAAQARQVEERSQLVTGAAGSIGSEVCRQLLEAGARRLVMVDTDENRLYMQLRRFQRRYPGRQVIAEVGDVREAARVRALFALHRPHDVFHAAARKHVPLMEAAPCEAVKTNVQGTLHVAEAARELGAERFVLTSTDKAVRPTSVMGASKRLAELLVDHLGREGATRFCVVRFGNVLDSAGSVVPLFRSQITAGGPVTVTHPEATRFAMTISEAVGLVLRAAYGDHGRLCVLDMGEPIRILDLARYMITMSGRVPEVDVPIELIGLRPGEKLEEELIGEGEVEVRRVEEKVRVVEGPEPPEDLLERLEPLLRAARAEDTAEVLRRLPELVAGYRPPSEPAPGVAALASSPR